MPHNLVCGLVVRVPGYTSRGPVSIPVLLDFQSSRSGTGSTQPREYNWGAQWPESASKLYWPSDRRQLKSYLEEKVAAPVKKTEITTVGVRHADHVAPSIPRSLH
jgi:hypothetical protein